MENIKTIAFDIDGTLVNPRSKQIDPSTVNVIKELKEAGYRLLLSTGRSKEAADETGVLKLTQWDGYVFNNGQVVMDEHFDVIFEKPIDTHIIKEIISKANKREIAVLLQSHRWHLVSEVNEYVLKVHQKLGSPIPEREDYQGENIYTLMIYGEDFSLLEPYPQLRLVQGHASYVDVLLKGHTKASGLQYLIDKHEPFIAFGDSDNDVEMVIMSSLSVAMSDSSQALKKVATHVSTTATDEIATMVKQLNLL